MPQELYYKEALKLGQKEYRNAIAQNDNPYLPVLDDIVPPEKGLTGIHLGVTQIPMWFVVGTKSGGRVNAFTKNFLPILEEGTEFADKWEALYRSHISEGIRDPVKVYEYLEFNRYTKINFIEFNKRGKYRELMRAVGTSYGVWWSIEEQRRFSGAYYLFEQAFSAMGGTRLKTTIADVGKPFLTPFYTQTGDIIGARRHELSLEQIIGMDYLADNVIGRIPGYDELSLIGRKTVDMVGIGQAKQKEGTGV